jgi:hypothetical protein
VTKIEILFILGFALTTTGIALISRPGAFIFAGVALCALSIAAAAIKAKLPPKKPDDKVAT